MKSIRLLFLLILFLSCSKIDPLTWGDNHTRIAELPGARTVFTSHILKSGEWLAVASGKDPSGNYSILNSYRCPARNGAWTGPDSALKLGGDCRRLYLSQMEDGLLSLLLGTEKIAEDSSLFQTFMAYSYDYGRLYTVPKPVQVQGYHSLRPAGKMIELSDASRLFPAAAHNMSDHPVMLTLRSIDGEHWQVVPVAVFPDSIDLKQVSASILQKEPGKLIGLISDGDPQHKIERISSNDWGRTWAEPAETNIAGANADLIRTWDGALVSVFLDAYPNGISMQTSFDGGRTWENEKTVWSASLPVLSRFSGPVLGLFPDHTLAVTYTNPKKMGADLNAVFFTLSDFQVPAGLSASKDSEGHVSLRWNAIRNADYYLVFRDLEENFVPDVHPAQGNIIGMPCANQFKDLSADTSMTYFYRIAPVRGRGLLDPNGGGIGQPSESIGVQ